MCLFEDTEQKIMVSAHKTEKDMLLVEIRGKLSLGCYYALSGDTLS